MAQENLLRKQVSAELKKRRLIVTTILLLSFLYLGASLVFGNVGVFRYMELKQKGVSLDREIREIEAKNAKLRSELKLIKENPFYIERYAREDFGMARPDEYIFTYDR